MKYNNPPGDTEELFVSASYDTLVKPTLSIYRDITSYPGTYFNLSLSHSIPVYKDITLDLGASAGYFVGSDNYWKTYESGTRDYTGKKYSAFHDGMVKAGSTIRVAKNLSIQPIAQYWFPLRDSHYFMEDFQSVKTHLTASLMLLRQSLSIYLSYISLLLLL
jgi:hypothetical protein